MEKLRHLKRSRDRSGEREDVAKGETISYRSGVTESLEQVCVWRKRLREMGRE